MVSRSLSLRICLLVIRTEGLGYWDDNNWKQVNILSFRPKWNISHRINIQLCLWLTWKVSPLKPRVQLKSKLNRVFITTLFHCQQNFALWKFRQCEFSPWRNFASANFCYCEISQLRIFAPTKFGQNEISPRWQRKFVWLDENSQALCRNFVAKFRRIFARTKNEKHRISFASLLHSTVWSSVSNVHVAEGYLFSRSSRNSCKDYKIRKIIIQKISACKNLVV